MSGTAAHDAAARDCIRTSLDETLVVEAAAGTGKTTVLVDRIVNMLASGRTSVDSLVAVTFTEKAAGELKLRLRGALEEHRAAATVGTPRHLHLNDALQHLEEAHVSTIHGFCAELLRERPVEAKVDPRFATLTERQAQRLYEGAFTRWLHEQLEAPGPGVARALRRTARRDDGWGPARRVGDEGPSTRLRQAGWTLCEWRDFPGRWRRDPFDRNATIDAIVAALAVFAELAADPANPLDGFFTCVRPAVQLVDRIRYEERAGTRRDYHGLEAQLVALLTYRFRRPTKGSGATYKPGVSRRVVHEAHEAVLPHLVAFVENTDADLVALLRDELWETVERYEQAKAATGALDFLDLLVKARDVVKECRPVRAAFQRRFSHIFVDEFQDTDPVQAELLMLLAADDAAVTDWRRVRPVPGKLFVVGDPKQSIYRFRRADVGIYRQVCAQLVAHGARQVELTKSFRAVPALQRAINLAFSAHMTGDDLTLQADYVALQPARDDHDGQPAVVALPVPDPYSGHRVTNTQIDATLPDAVGAFIAWLVNESGWRVTERSAREQRVPVAARHVCVLFRRFDKQGEDVTRPYVEALEARGVPHLLVGGRSFHDRDEVEVLRTALTAIEWPDDALSVFGALHGSLFALPDDLLFEYKSAVGSWHPFTPHEDCREALRPVADALAIVRDLHLGRNHRPVAETIARLLDATRAHAGFALQKGGEQVLANALHVGELARQYEATGGISFRGFVTQLRDDAVTTKAEEAPVLEEGSDGVRVMTVHRAKGLEFPVVVLADMTAGLTGFRASRYIDAGRGLCAVRLAGWSPVDLTEREEEERARDRSEGVRLAYVAATRARDVLVVPALGDGPFEGGWLSPLDASLYPAQDRRHLAEVAPGCPRFGHDTVVDRVGTRPAGAMSPGRHVCQDDRGQRADVVWWDPSALSLGVKPVNGVRGGDLLAKDGAEAAVADGREQYAVWRRARARAVASGKTESQRPRTVRLVAADRTAEGLALPVPVTWIERAGAETRPYRASGPRFGSLVHAVLAGVDLAEAEPAVRGLAAMHARVLGCPAHEVDEAVARVTEALAQAIFARIRAAALVGRCYREWPVVMKANDTAIEGVVDIVFEDEGGWTVLDYKTDRDTAVDDRLYEHQVAIYAEAASRALGQPVSAAIVRV